MRPDSSSGHGFLSEDRGGVTLEYAVILSLVAVGLSAAVLAVGRMLVVAFVTRETWLLLPFP